MPLFLDVEPTNVKQWLAIATNGLCDHAKERIGEEVRAHVDEAIETSVANGVDHEQAERLAVRELGPPRRAWRMYRREHLTEETYLYLVQFQEPFEHTATHIRILEWLVLPYIALVVSTVILPGFEESDILLLASAISLGLITYALRIARFAAKRSSIKFRFGVYLALYTVGIAAYFIAIAFRSALAYVHDSGYLPGPTFLFILVVSMFAIPMTMLNAIDFWHKYSPHLSN